MSDIGAVVCEVYAVGARLVVLDSRLAVDGEISEELKKKVRSHRGELLDALGGDPLGKEGWEVRTALYRQALRWLDRELETLELKGTSRERSAIEVLCRQDMAERLNGAWCDGSFDEFRVALRSYVRAGLRATERPKGLTRET